MMRIDIQTMDGVQVPAVAAVVVLAIVFGLALFGPIYTAIYNCERQRRKEKEERQRVSEASSRELKVGISRKQCIEILSPSVGDTNYSTDSDGTMRFVTRWGGPWRGDEYPLEWTVVAFDENDRVESWHVFP